MGICVNVARVNPALVAGETREHFAIGSRVSLRSIRATFFLRLTYNLAILKQKVVT